jgi:hypothetical protein
MTACFGSTLKIGEVYSPISLSACIKNKLLKINRNFPPEWSGMRARDKLTEESPGGPTKIKDSFVEYALKNP